MDRNLLWTILICLWTICCLFVCSNAYYIKNPKNKPPPAKHGFDLNLVQQDEIGIVFLIDSSFGEINARRNDQSKNLY